jgi:hypothetical protein
MKFFTFIIIVVLVVIIIFTIGSINSPSVPDVEHSNIIDEIQNKISLAADQSDTYIRSKLKILYDNLQLYKLVNTQKEHISDIKKKIVDFLDNHNLPYSAEYILKSAASIK